jgi:glycine/sarcosine N-methyltransferase
MTEQILSFYDPLAEHYHLIFDDWDKAIDRQGPIIDRLIATRAPAGTLRILDCACGIGTQSIALAKLGHSVSGADLSHIAVARARSEALKRSQQINFRVSDMTSMQEIAERDFDVAIAFDNALPHLSLDQLTRAAAAIKSVLKPGGLFVASIRDYDQILLEKPTIQQPAFYSTGGDRRIVHQVWVWVDETKYVVHLYITILKPDGWKSLHFVSEYYPIRREQLASILRSAGFTDVDWVMPSESGFYQPIVMASRPM